ncbi:hypothetical protein M0805_005789 [Coniferiporia weirii]|nr:hypothetical protein M0805_005789 [Coniferiporia weirii]
MAPIVLLLRTVFEAILEVFLLCLAGYLLSRKGILDKRTQKQMNRLNVSLFTPCLLFSKIAFSLSPAKLRELWIIPIFFVLVTSVSMCISFFLGWAFRLKRSQRNFAVAASMFMNSNSLPIALMQSLIITVPGLKWDEEDTKSAMLGRALSYTVLYYALGMVVRWSYGVRLLSQADPEGSEAERQPQEARTHDERPPSIFVNNPEEISHPSDTDENEFSEATEATAVMPGHNGLFSGAANGLPSRGGRVKTYAHDRKNILPRAFMSFPNTPTQSAITLPIASSSSSLAPRYDQDSDFDSECSNSDEPLLLPDSSSRWQRRRRSITAPTSSHLHSLVRRFTRRLSRRVKKSVRTLNEFMTAPLWAVFLSIIVALVPPLQHTLDAHLQPIKGALNAGGNCSIPITLVVLGAYFYKPPAEEESGAIKPRDSSLSSTRNNEGERMDRAGRRNSSLSTGRSASFAGSMRSMFRLSRLDRSKGRKKDRKDASQPGETRTVVIAVMSRMLLTPLILLPFMSLVAKYDIPKIFDDPVFLVASVLLISSPPALTLVQITQVSSGDAFERLISRTIFWSYCVITPPATIIYVVIGLLLTKL